MNILINTNTLRNALQDIMGVVSKDLSMPILSHVLIEKNGKQINITGTNTEMQITVKSTFLESDDFDPITVSGRKLYDIVRSLEDQELQLTTSRNRLILKSNNSSFKLSTLPANNFPTFDETKFVETFTINQAQLLDLLNKTSFSMATDPDVRYVLCGLLLVITPNNLTAVATNTHRLAISSTRLEKSQINNIECIVPRKAVVELIRLLQGDKEAKVSVANNQIRVDFKDLNFISTLIDGRYPAGWRGVIPTSAIMEISLEKQNIRPALQRVSILTNEFKAIRVEATNEKIVLSSENKSAEEAKETIKYQSGSTESIKVVVGFNVGYLIDAINACSGKEIVIGLNGLDEAPGQSDTRKSKTLATLISSPSDGNTKYVVMPYKL